MPPWELAFGGVGGSDVEGGEHALEIVSAGLDSTDGGALAGVEGHAFEGIPDIVACDEAEAYETGFQDAIGFDGVADHAREFLADGNGVDVDDVAIDPGFGAEGDVEGGVEGI